jgi:hypothetical protein
MCKAWKQASLILLIAVPLTAAAADGLSQLGLTPPAVKEAIGGIVTAGVYNPGLPAAAFKALPPATRAQAVTAAAGWVRTYTATPEFSAQYAKLRDRQKPDPPTWDATPEQELQQADDDQKKQMEESKQAIANLPPEQRKAVEAGLQAAAEMTARMNTPEARKMRLDAIRTDRAQRTKEYQDVLARWKQQYPDDPRPVIARRLREFLQLSTDVDYAAKLNANGTFANPAYQAKPSQWKMCYRAGREATAAARAAAEAWLKELGA